MCTDPLERTALQLESVDPPLSVRSFRVTEGMSQLFEVDVIARGAIADLDLEAPIGRDAAFTTVLQMQAQVIDRAWSGLCTRAEQIRCEPTGLSTYRLILRPHLWKLSQRTNYRLFQHISIIDIAQTLLNEWNIDFDMRVQADRYPKLELRTQYGESDHAFLSRLLEEAGIAYFFEDRLILSDAPQVETERGMPLSYTDDPSLHAARSAEFAKAVHIAHRALPGAYQQRDFDFRRPELELLCTVDAQSAAEQKWEQFDYQPGGFLHERNEGGNTPHADDKGPGRHEAQFGNDRAELSMQRTRARKQVVRFESNAVDLYPGRVFRILDHPHRALLTSLLSIRHEIARDEDGEWTITTEALPTTTPYHPPAVTEKPRVEAVQTAAIVGPQGEEIHTDEYGRVRVQFPWDRYGARDENSSCWMRVNQGWAGAGYGNINLPRIGQEVLVAFLDGNPDHPIVVGRVFNEASPVPYKLPENKTVSTWRSNSSPQNGGFNEIRFEDAQGRELVYTQAQKDAMSLIKNDEMTVVGRNRAQLVRGSETKTVVGPQTKLVQGAMSTTVGDSESKTVSKNSTNTVGDTDASIVGKMWSVTIARSLAGPLAQAFGGTFSALAPVLKGVLGSTLGKVPTTALGLPFLGNEQGPMAKLGASLLPKALGLLGQGASSIKKGGGRPPTGIRMLDEMIVLTTGGASITLKGDDIILSAKGTITSVSKKDTTVLSQGGSITVQGGPMVYINPAEKSADATRMSQAAHSGAGFIGGGK